MGFKNGYRVLLALVIGSMALPAIAWELSGTKQVVLHTRDGQRIPFGSVDFQPKGDRIGFTLHPDHKQFKDFFLSMKEFKCLESSEEILCHVPYPYPNPGTVTREDLRWLEHSLLFLFKAPRDFGAKLWNGLYYRMRITDKGIVGEPQAIDLGLIGSTPDDPSVPPYGQAERTDIPANSRWISGLSIE